MNTDIALKRFRTSIAQGFKASTYENGFHRCGEGQTDLGGGHHPKWGWRRSRKAPSIWWTEPVAAVVVMEEVMEVGVVKEVVMEVWVGMEAVEAVEAALGSTLPIR